MRKFFSVLLCLLILTLAGAACSDSDSTSDETVSGTAAEGAALANASVTLRDSTGTSIQTTTDSNGKFSLNVNNLTGPFFIRVQQSGGGFLYGFTYDLGNANVHPYTTLALEIYYDLQGLDLDTAFSSLTTSTPKPTRQELDLLTDLITNTIEKWLIDQGLNPEGFDIFKTPFDADGDGFDGLLDNTTINLSGANPQVTISSFKTTQTTTFTADSNNKTVQSSTTTNSPSGQSNSQQTYTISNSQDFQSAVEGVQATVGNFQNAVNNNGGNLSASHLSPFLAFNFLHDGEDGTQWAGRQAQDFRGLTIDSIRIERVISFDSNNSTLRVLLKIPTFDQTITTNLFNQVTSNVVKGQEVRELEMTFVKNNNTWEFLGNQRQARVEVWPEVRKIQNPSGTQVKTFVRAEIYAPKGDLTSADITGGSIFSNTAFTKDSRTLVETLKPTPSTSQKLEWDVFSASQEVTSFPSNGTTFTVNLTPSSGSAQNLSITSQFNTAEVVNLFGPQGFLLKDANLGSTLNLTWTKPQSFGVRDVLLQGRNLSSNFICPIDANERLLAQNATSGSVSLPKKCNGEEVTEAQIHLLYQGSNGARSRLVYVFTDLPFITSLSPDNGPVTGGTSVTLKGANFAAGSTTLTIGGSAVSNLLVQDSQTITFDSPTGSAGAQDVVVTTPGGTTTKSGGFTYLSVPTVTGISPQSGPTTGGTTVTITGTNFTSNTSVTVAGNQATNVNVLSSTQLTADVPVGSPGEQTVTVTTGGGSDTTTFTYVPGPSIASVSPSNGPTTGGTTVTITGSDFLATIGGSQTSVVQSVKFGTKSATISSVTVQSGSTHQIVVTTPSHVAGTKDVTVTTTGGTDIEADGFFYNGPPTVTSVDPNEGPSAGGNTVTIKGAGFDPGNTTVQFGTGNTASIQSQDTTEIKVTAPAVSAGSVNVIVTTPGGSDNSKTYTFFDAPTITNVSPNQGPTTGGTSVTVDGTNFVSGKTKVTVDGNAVASLNVVSATQLTFNTPAGVVGGQTLKVETPGGIANDTFTYFATLSITSISPNSGPLGGGTSVTISGSNFVSGTTVTIGGNALNSLNIVSSTKITGTTPTSSTTGAKDVVVTNPGGTDTLTGGFTYLGTPTITGVSPQSGPTSGNTTITITGSNFAAGNTTVTIGGNSATNVNVLSATQITADTPPGTAGEQTLTVTTPGGNASDTFTYVASPTITSVSPTDGPVGGSTTVTIQGTNFLATVGGSQASVVQSVTVGAKSATISSVSVVSGSTHQVVISTPSHTAGTKDVTVNTSGGSATEVAGFEYHNSPSVASISPNEGPTTGGTSVTITGSNFSPGDTTVTVGGTSATINSITTTDIVITTPTGSAGAATVVVTNPGGNDSSQTFNYRATPSISNVSPNKGPSSGGTSVTLTGTNFVSGSTTVTVDSNPVSSLSVSSSTQLSFDTPAGVAGGREVKVTTAGGSATATFTYFDAPTITSISPNEGPAGSGTSVTITGTKFIAGDTTVTIGGQAVSNLNIVSSTKITATTPSLSAGAEDVVVSGTGGSDTLTNGFTYRAAPTVTGISPESGPTGGGTTVTITGTNFVAGSTSVSFNGNAATNINVISSTQLTADTPAGSAGEINFTVTTTTTSQTSAVNSSSTFTYVDAPTITLVRNTNSNILSPDGTTSGGDNVLIRGTNFIATVNGISTNVIQSVTIGGKAVTIQTVVDQGGGVHEITCTTASHTAGPKDVVVNTSGGTVTDGGGFIYHDAPSVSTVNPGSGPQSGNIKVTMTGSNFPVGKTTVNFGPSAATITSNNTSQLEVTIPAGTGTVTISVITPGGTDNSQSFTYFASPSISNVSPNQGPAAGGTSVTVTGQNFAAGNTTVTIDGNSVANLNITSATQLTFDTPAGIAGAQQLKVSTPGGDATDTFTYFNGPTITSISPNNGPTAGGTSVTITGSNFAAGNTTVNIAGTGLQNLTVVSSTKITGNTPTASAGAQDVVVTTPGGSDTLTGGFTYHAVPTVTAISPKSGPTAGGTTVTITGTNFAAGNTTVTVAGNSATNINVVSSTQLTADTPAGTAGEQTVTVTTPGGSDTTNFTYVADPTITSLSPTEGTTSGGTSVTIQGTNFLATVGGSQVSIVQKVTFGGKAGNITGVSDAGGGVHQITATTPSHTAGAKDVTVTTTAGSETLGGGFTYHAPPSVTSLSPNQGPITGGTTVTINGSNFSLGNTTVNFGSNPATIQSNSGSQIVVTSPAGSGSVTVTVTTPGGNDTSQNFTYFAVPTISNVSPTQGPAAGGTTVTVDGTNFSAGNTTVTIDGNAVANLNISSATQLTFDTPPGIAGAQQLKVSTPGGDATDTFTYFNSPTITSISPQNGPIAGGTSVTITGSNFATGNTTVNIGGAGLQNLNIVSSTQITGTTPSGSAGAQNVVVTTPGGSDTLTGGFTYHAVPTVTSVSPQAGPTAGGTTVTIGGTNFATGVTQVTIDGNTATNINIISSTQLTADTPSGTAGEKTVTVTTPGGSDTANFTYVAPPTISSINPTKGGTSGGTSVTIQGTNFLANIGGSLVSVVQKVTFGGISGTINNVNNLGGGNHEIVVTTPAHTAGAKDVIVTTSGGSETLGGAFTYHAPPSISSINPNQGPVGGGTTVIINGANFSQGDTSVTFGSNNATIQSNSGTQLEVTSPAATSAGAVTVTVTNPAGNDTTTFTYFAAPTITNVSPAQGPAAGGTTVTVDGTNFSAGNTTVTIDGNAVTSLNITSATQMTFDTPAGIAGAQQLKVSTPGGDATDTFTYFNSPTITSISPANGPSAGGTAVTISGSNFTAGMTVTIGGANLQNQSVNSSSQITGNAPSRPAGAQDVVVSNAGGSDTLTNGFTYHDAPSVTNVSPKSGSTAGGTTITVTGTNFAAGVTTLTINGNSATNVNVISTTQLTADTPSGTAGEQTLTVTTPGGSANNTFTYVAPPTITSVSPTNGPTGGGTTVAIQGTNFLATIGGSQSSVVQSVTFGGKAATVGSVNDVGGGVHEITVTTPSHTAGAKDVKVVTTGGDETLGGAFTYHAAPSVSSVSPANGPDNGGTTVTISGSNFSVGNTTVTFGSNNATIQSNSGSQIVVTSPAGNGTVNVNVTTPGGTDSSQTFTYFTDPLITNVAPDQGPSAGGTSVTVDGQNFAAGNTTVTIDGNAVSNLNIVSATQLTFDTPAGIAGTQELKVTTPGGSATANYTYFNNPTIASISPNNGPVAGGTAVTITGSNFSAGNTTVTVGGSNLQSLSVTSSTQLTGNVPVGTAGAQDVVVTTPGGSDTLTDGFTYHAAPTVTNISPKSGPTAGGTTVTLTGTDFASGVTTVTVDGNAATNINVISSTQLTADTPSGTAGEKTVTVTTPGGSANSNFSYVPSPTISSINPTDGPIGGSTNVTIQGTNFIATVSGSQTSVIQSVTFGGKAASVGSVIDLGGGTHQISLTTPSHTVGAKDVTVTTTGGSVTLGGGFTYHATPSISSISPDNGPLAGGTSVTITGTNFSVGNTTVTFGSNNATIQSNSGTQVVVTSPGAVSTGSVTVTLTTPGGSDTGTFTYFAAPSISNVSPDQGPSAGGTSVTVDGANFAVGNTTVTIDGNAVTSLNVTASQLTFNTPAGIAGTQQLKVSTPGGDATDTFTYFNTPTITAISPANGPVAGGTAVTIQGSNFIAGNTNVTIGGTNLQNLTVTSSNQITGNTPVGTAGAQDVVVSNPGGSDTLTGGFTYHNAPTVTAVNPQSGPTSGGTTITVTGTNFAAGVTKVSVDGNSATNVNVLSSTQLTADTPSGTTGEKQVSVSTPGGSDTANFTYVAAPTITSVSPNDGPTAGGTSVTIQGTNFLASIGGSQSSVIQSVTVGGNSATIGSVSDLGGGVHSVVISTPAHTAGAKDVTVTTTAGSATSGGAFTYHAAPSISTISPANGPEGGGTTVTINGSNFSVGNTTVTFGGSNATIQSNSGTQVVVTSPAGTGSVTVTLTTPGGNDTTNFTYFAAPTISNVTPDQGPTSGGTSVTVDGANFSTGNTTVTIDGNAVASLNIVSASQLTFNTPVGVAGAQQLKVSTPGGDATDTFTYFAAPTLTSISPSGGVDQGGTAVTITGTNFTAPLANTQITIGGSALTGVNIVSDTKITGTTPSGTPGAQDVVLTTPGGTDTLTGGFTYHADPTVTGINPQSGPLAGGTTVTITGTNFAAGSTTVDIGGSAATNVNVLSSTQLTADTPSGTAGEKTVTVTTPGGSDTTTFTYVDSPSISTISPASGPTAGTTSVNIDGTNYLATIGGAANTSVVQSVTIGGKAATVNSVTDQGGGVHRINITTPSHSAGVKDVSVNTTGGTATAGGGFQYHAPPTVTSLSPNQGDDAGGDTVTINGTNFAPGATTVDFGANSATIASISTTQIIVTSPAGTGTVTVDVTTPGGSDTSQTFTYFADPSISTLSPNQGPSAGGTSVTMSGGNFVAGSTTVTIDGNAVANLSVTNASTLTFNTPAGTAGAREVKVTTPGGSATDTFTYFDAPTLTSITPNEGPTGGNTLVTIRGSNFPSSTANITALTIDGVALTSVTIVSDTEISARTPGGAAGAQDLVMTTPGGTDTLTGGFTYFAPPTITNVSPQSGSTAGGNTVTIDGTNFAAGSTTVTFDGNSGTNINVVSSTQLTVTAPSGTAGEQPVVVTTPGGSDNDTYTYVAPPTINTVNPANGPTGGLAGVNIDGTNFLATISGTANTSVVQSVTIGGKAATINSVTDQGGGVHRINIDVPSHSAGAKDVVVTTSAGSANLGGGFTYFAAPTVTSITPSQGDEAGGDSVTITGTNFAPGNTTVNFGANAATINTISDTQIVLTTPADTLGTPYPRNVTITVTTPGGSDNSGNFIYHDDPTISTTVPDKGPSAGGTTVTLTGTNFVAGQTTVTVGGAAAVNVNVTGPTGLTFDTPPGTAGARQLKVTTPGGSDTTTFTYFDVPTITSIAPNTGPSGGSQSVTIRGTNFTAAVGDTNVTIGGAAVTGLTIVSDTEITGTTPSGTAGARDVVVTTPGGTDTLAGGYTYFDAPTLTNVSPRSGTTAGGTSVTLTGTNFSAGNTTVAVGAKAGLNVNVTSSTELTFDTPSDTAGEKNVTVTTPGGTTTVTTATTFTHVAAPTIASLSDTDGPTGGGTAVTITGTNYMASIGGVSTDIVQTVSVGGKSVAFNTTSATTIDINTPSHTVGAKDIVVTTTGGSATLGGGFTYFAAPTVTNISPNEGFQGGGESVTITGTNFAPGNTTVNFGANAATIVSINSTQIVVTTPADTVGGPYPLGVTVDVITPGGNDNSQNFTYHAAPTITNVNPASGPVGGGTSVTLDGTNFVSGSTTVTIDGKAVANLVFVNPTQVTFDTPSGVAGDREVKVTTPGGSATDTFTYLDPPVITSLNPEEGQHTGGDTLEIFGNNFRATINTVDTNIVNSVTFTDGASNSTTVLSGGLTSVTSTKITLNTPNFSMAGLNAGALDVTVNTDGGSITLGGAFITYVAPSITTINPTSGSTAGGTNITISGNDFIVGSTTVTIDSNPVANLGVTATSITATTPPGTAGPQTVTVTTPGGSDTTTFTYVASPTITNITANLTNFAGINLGNIAEGPTTGQDPVTTNPIVVTITGTNFQDTGGNNVVTDVRFGGVSAANVTVTSNTNLTCELPAQASDGAKDVTVETTADTFTVGGGFIYYNAPTISGASPANGTTNGGTNVTLSGSNFVDASSVVQVTDITPTTSNGTNISVNSDTQLTFDTPAGAEGAADIRVTTPGGQVTSVGAFTYRDFAQVAPNMVSGQRLRPVLRWENATGETGYIVEVALDSGFNLIVDSGVVAADTVTHRVASGALVANQFYWWRVKAVFNGDEVLANTGSMRFNTAYQNDINGDGIGDVISAAPYGDDVGVANRGKVYVVVGVNGGGISGTGTINTQNNLTITGENQGDRFGASFATGDVNGDGQTDLIVGAPFYDNGANNNVGRVYVYYSTTISANLGSTIAATTADVILTGENIGDRFGYSVAVGDIIDTTSTFHQEVVVGAPYADGAGANRGRAYVFNGNGLVSGNASGAAAIMNGVANGDRFGWSVAAGDVTSDLASLSHIGDLVVGAPWNDSAGTNRGRIYVFEGSGTGVLNTGVDRTLDGQNTGGLLGWSLATGDFTGDGIGDLLSSEPFHGGNNDGAVYVHSGGFASNFADNNDIYFRNGQFTGDRLGMNLAAGDVNNDGIDDVIAGALYGGGSANDGRVYVEFGGTSLGPQNGVISTEANKIFDGASTGDRLGAYVAASDIDGNGTMDLVVGAPFRQTNNRGELYVVLSSETTSTITSIDHRAYFGVAQGDRLGSGHSTTEPVLENDVNGDGIPDIIVTARGDDFNSIADRGSVYIFFGNPGLNGDRNDPDNQADVRIRGVSTGDQLGQAAALGDVNGDGIADIAVGASFRDGTGNNRGAVSVIFGSNTIGGELGAESAADFIVRGQFDNDQLGHALAIGDFNQDGTGDLTMSSIEYDAGGNPNGGIVYIYFGSPGLSGTDSNPDGSGNAFRIVGSSASTSEFFGSSLAYGHNHRDTSRHHLSVGSPGYDVAGTDRGAAYIYEGLSTRSAGTTINSDGVGVFDSRIIGNDTFETLGTAVAFGDVDDDGRDDWLIGAEAADTDTRADNGAVYVYLSGSTIPNARNDPDSSAQAFLRGNNNDDFFGRTIVAFDVDNDGGDEFTVGAVRAELGALGAGADRGVAYTFLNLFSTNSPDSSGSTLRIQGQNNSGQLGGALASGDFNADGKPDLIIGVQSYPAGTNNRGKAYVFFGTSPNTTTPDTGADFRMESLVNGDLFGGDLDSSGR